MTALRNIKLTIQYDGTNYAGWQFQKNALSIQDVIERRLKTILREKVNLVGSGRTDAGVHAYEQAANFKTHAVLPLKNIQIALNSRLPKDVVVVGIEEKPLRFNSQHDAKSKLYRYTIVNGDFIDPFIRPFAVKCFYKLNIGRMRRAAKFLEGRHDFRAFKAADKSDGGELRDTVRTVKKIGIGKKGNVIYIDIEADGFLYNMARSIVGTLIEIGRGKMDLRRLNEILLAKDRRLSGPTAPARGLCLMKVRY